jgi:hypothetical protein
VSMQRWVTSSSSSSSHLSIDNGLLGDGCVDAWQLVPEHEHLRTRPAGLIACRLLCATTYPFPHPILLLEWLAGCLAGTCASLAGPYCVTWCAACRCVGMAFQVTATTSVSPIPRA